MKRSIISLTGLILIIALTFSSCQKGSESKLLDLTINKQNIPDIIKQLKEENLLDPQEILFFSNGLGRLSNISPDTLNGMTVGEIIESQTSFLNENNYMQLSLAATRIAMNMNYSIKYLGIRPLIDTVKKKQGTTVLYEFKNMSEKAVKKIDGFLQFYDQANNIIKQFELDNTEIIKPKSSLQFYKSFNYNPAEPRDSIIKYHNTSLIVRWQPVSLEFVDGSKMEAK